MSKCSRCGVAFPDNFIGWNTHHGGPLCDDCYFSFRKATFGFVGGYFWCCPDCSKPLLVVPFKSPNKCNIYMYKTHNSTTLEQAIERDRVVQEGGHCSNCGRLIQIDMAFAAARRFIDGGRITRG